jgi:hypothetical protein
MENVGRNGVVRSFILDTINISDTEQSGANRSSTFKLKAVLRRH